jgi:hypothetical protein
LHSRVTGRREQLAQAGDLLVGERGRGVDGGADLAGQAHGAKVAVGFENLGMVSAVVTVQSVSPTAGLQYGTGHDGSTSHH